MLVGVLLVLGLANAQAATRFSFDLPEQALAQSLNQLSNQTQTPVLFPYHLVENRKAKAIKGSYTLMEVVAVLLRNTALAASFSAKGVLVISKRNANTKKNNGDETMSMKRNILAMAVGGFLSGGVAAQESGADDSMNWLLEEVVVTATKRGVGTSIQDTAMAISALGGDTIEKRGLVGMDDYLRTLPGVNMQDRGAGQNSVVIRSVAVNPQLESSTVGVYFGEVPLADLGGAGTNGQGGNYDLKLVDVERIEVLRGPQGTLYGSGSMGGTVRVLPVAPNVENLEGALKTRFSSTDGGGNNHMIQGVVNVPLVEDTLAVRAVAYGFENSGFIDNVAASNPSSALQGAIAAGGVARDQSEVGGDEYSGFRLTSLWTPTEELDLSLSYIRQDIDQQGQPESNLDFTEDYQQERLGVGPDGARSERLASDLTVTNLVVNYDLAWGQVSSSSSWLDYQSASDSDMSVLTAAFLGSAMPYYNRGEKDVEAFTQELRLSSAFEGNIQFVAGLYFEDRESDSLQTWSWSGDSALDPAPGLNFFNVPGAESLEQQALFGEVTYAATERLELTLGARYFDYEREVESGFAAFAASAPLSSSVSVDESDTTYKANVSFHANDDTLLYGQWAEGFRLGTGLPDPNPDTLCDPDGNGIIDELGIARPTQTDSDRSESFELGLKTQFMDRRLTLNAAVYRIDWVDIPIDVSPTQSCTVQLNAGEASSEGIELEMQALLSESLRLSASASYGEATLDEDSVLGNKGDNVPGSADFNLSVGLEYAFDLGSHPSFARLDYSYQSEYFSSVAETGQASGGEGQLNLKAGIELDQLSVDVFINNATNAEGFTWTESLLSSAFGSLRAYQVRPRTVGLNVGYRF